MLPQYFEFFNPVKIISGLKALDNVPFELQQLAVERPMLITDQGVSKAGLLNPVLQGFAGSGLSLGVVFDGVPPDSSLATVQQAAELYHEHACDALLAVGGGSVIDTAKGLNICISHNSLDLKSFAGSDRVNRPLQPLLVVPTTAGTGSEVTSVALVSDEDEQMKMIFSSLFLLPRVAVLDPRMLQTLPPLATAATGMDALTHAIEAFTCLQKNPLSDAYAWAALELISSNLLRSVQKGRDVRSRLAMANAATMAGIAFSNSMVGLLHSLGHAAGSVCRLPHGVVMSIFLPLVLEFNLPRIKHELGRLLLPLGGRQGAAAAAIRDGFVAAYLAQGGEGERPSLRIYDTAALGATGAYEQAAGSGADFIVGPLLKEELAELGGAELPAVPTLALNWTENDAVLPSHMFQFALAPEQEASAVARRALAEGHGRALAMAHDTEQGRRIMESFIAAFRAGGGEVLGWQAFDPRASDFSAEITRLLLINESRARHQQLQAALGRRLEHEPRRRQDADFIFLAARASDGVLIRPQLRFHYAGDLPVYATSSIYDPVRRDQSDLNGILFADMPWRVGADDVELMAEFAAFGERALARNGRLYAFGLDAYRLVPLLNNRSERLQDGMDGATGVLRLGADGRIQRDLAWGSFRRGDVEPAPLPEPELAQDATGEPAPEAGAPPGE